MVLSVQTSSLFHVLTKHNCSPPTPHPPASPNPFPLKSYPSYYLFSETATVVVQDDTPLKEGPPSRGPVDMETPVFVNGGFSYRPGLVSGRTPSVAAGRPLASQPFRAKILAPQI